MNLPFIYTIPLHLFFLIIVLAIALFYIIGQKYKVHRFEKDKEIKKTELATINGTLLGLLGLLLAFSFNMANSRFDDRRKVIVQEANEIGTTFVRMELYPDTIEKKLKAHLKEYLEERIAYYEAKIDLKQAMIHYDNANKISQKIWTIVADDSKIDSIGTRSRMMIPVLNNMIDITLERIALDEAKIPPTIVYLLLILGFISSFLLGYDNNIKIDWIVVFGLALTLGLTIYIILDLDSARRGLIDIDSANSKMIELRSMFNN